MKAIVGSRQIGKTLQLCRLFVKDPQGVLLTASFDASRRIIEDQLPKALAEIGELDKIEHYARRVVSWGLACSASRGMEKPPHFYVDELPWASGLRIMAYTASIGE